MGLKHSQKNYPEDCFILRGTLPTKLNSRDNNIGARCSCSINALTYCNEFTEKR